MNLDEIYHYIREDVQTVLEEYDVSFLSDNDFEALIDDCTDQLVYSGRYDCIAGYWSHLEKLIKKLIDERLLLMKQTKGV